MTQGYLLGIGTNLDPERNVPAIVEALLRCFGSIQLSRFYQTLPIGMQSTKRFINFCAFVPTELGPEACKAACVAIEIALGRDRSHPASKTRDRPADLDLLIQLGNDGEWVQLEPVPDYLAVAAAELTAVLSPGADVPALTGCVRGFVLRGRWLGETPTTIDGNDGPGLVAVGQDRIDG